MINQNILHLENAYKKHLLDDENRRGGRFRMVKVDSNMGKLLDLSHCGALVRKKRFQKLPSMATFPIRIHFEECVVTLNARLVRDYKVKGIGRLMGLEFLDVRPEQRESIKEIIERSRNWEVITRDQSQDAA